MLLQDSAASTGLRISEPDGQAVVGFGGRIYALQLQLAVQVHDALQTRATANAAVRVVQPPQGLPRGDGHRWLRGSGQGNQGAGQATSSRAAALL